MSKSVYTTISTILLKQISQAQPIPGLRQLRRGRRLPLQAAMHGADACAAQLVIEEIDIEAGEMRLHQALVQFQVENLKP